MNPIFLAWHLGCTGPIPLPDVELPPLCAEPARDPTIAPDLVAWGERFATSGNRFYSEVEWRGLEALGDDLGDTPDERVRNELQRGWHRMKFGDLDGAVQDFAAAEAESDAAGLEWRGRARQMLGAAWMRKGETANCITNGSASACIVPFDEHGVHSDPTGMENAAAAFSRCLDEDLPGHPSVLWLLNVTYMARGRWPDDVPEAWRLPADLLDAEAPAEPWTNHVPALGMGEPTLAGGSALEDFDGDGRLDVLVSSQEPEVGMDLYLNVGDGRFCQASRQSGVAAFPGILDFKAADYDNDGDVDVIAPRGAWQSREGAVRPSLLRNDGQGHFEDVAVEAGLSSREVDGPSQVATWGDVDGDGWLDLFLGREDDDALPDARRVSSLYHNQRDGTFVDVGPDAGVTDNGYVKGASFFDLDNDGDPDLYVSAISGPNHLYENLGGLRFVDRAEEFGVTLPVQSFASAPIDVDQDGWLDLVVPAFTNNYPGGGPLEPTYFRSEAAFVQDKLGLPIDSGWSETARVYHNLGGTGFEDLTLAMGLDDIHSTMGFTVGDLDMDGWTDLHFSTGAPEYDALEPNVSYTNDGGERFLDVTTDVRMGHLQKGHGPSFGDVDEDGDEDLFVEMGGAFRGDPAPSVLFGNPTNDADHARRHAVTLRLVGVTSNRGAIGARVAVVTPGRTFHHVVGQTGSFGGNSLQVEVALADESEVTRVEIRWPGGDDEVVDGVPIDHVVTIREGEGVVGSRPFARFGLDGDLPTHPM